MLILPNNLPDNLIQFSPPIYLEPIKIANRSYEVSVIGKNYHPSTDMWTYYGMTTTGATVTCTTYSGTLEDFDGASLMNCQWILHIK